MTARSSLARPRVDAATAPAPLASATGSAPPAGPGETLCAEYLALTIARREGWGPDRALHLAGLVGLHPDRVARLLRDADVLAITTRRARLDAITCRPAVAS